MFDLVSANAVLQVFEGLVKFDPQTLKITPALAESWDVSQDGRVYTFYLRKGVHFHDNACFEGGKGRELTAEDVVWSFTQLCTPGPDNRVFAYTFKDRIAGANAFYEAAQTGSPMREVAGFRAIGTHSVELTLEQPSNSFLYVLAQAGVVIMPHEAIERYGTDARVGTGAFLAPTAATDRDFVMVRNAAYYGVDSAGNQLPYLDTVVFTRMDNKQLELEAFQEGRLHAVSGLPSQAVLKLVETHIDAFRGSAAKWVLAPSPEMSTDYYQFNMTTPALKDVRVRKAINYALNRNALVDVVLKGEAYGPGVNGICPPTFDGYNTRAIEGYRYDPEKARDLLREAGYPNGQNFPPLQLEISQRGYQNARVAFEVQNQLRNVLGINLALEVSPLDAKIEHDQYAKAAISQKSWIADFPSPESFLHLFYGAGVPETLDEPSFPNTARYKSTAFDELFEAALAERDQRAAYEYFKKAEQQLMDDAPILVLWYNEAHLLRQANLKRYWSNPLNCMDLSHVFFKEQAEEGQPEASN